MTGICPVVLVVEDEPVVRLSACEEFREEGFIVHEASDAYQGLSALETNSDITLLFTDVQMPGTMNGLHLSFLARRNWPSLHIIVVSGLLTVGMEPLPSGAVFIPKPYITATVVDRIRELHAL